MARQQPQLNISTIMYMDLPACPTCQEAIGQALLRQLSETQLPLAFSDRLDCGHMIQGSVSSTDPEALVRFGPTESKPSYSVRIALRTWNDSEQEETVA